MVTRLALIKELASIVPPEVLVVTSIGNNSYFWAELTDREATLFHSTLGMCTPAAFGLAMALPQRKVLALDSDGNLTLELGRAWHHRQRKSDQFNGPGDGQSAIIWAATKKSRVCRTATGGKMKLQEVAKGCGIASAHLVQDVAKFREKIQTGAQERRAAFYLRPGRGASILSRPPKTKHVLDPRENKYQFAKYIERTEGVQILGGGLGNFG